ncbi:MAG: hypothetical protein WCC41_09000, partial [Rhodomicrobium sp.]
FGARPGQFASITAFIRRHSSLRSRLKPADEEKHHQSSYRRTIVVALSSSNILKSIITIAILHRKTAHRTSQ